MADENTDPDKITWEGADGKTYSLDLKKIKPFWIWSCTEEDMLVGLVPDPVEQQREHDAIEDAKCPQVRCDVCQETDALSPNGGLLMCGSCLEAVGCTWGTSIGPGPSREDRDRKASSVL